MRIKEGIYSFKVKENNFYSSRYWPYRKCKWDSKRKRYNIKMISFQEEKPYIEGTKKPVKLSMLEQSLDYLPEKMNMFYDKLKICFWKI